MTSTSPLTPNNRQPAGNCTCGATSAREILERVRDSAGASRAVLDQHYELTAMMVRRRTADGTRQEVLVEVIHEPRATDGHEWMLNATDELRDRQIGPVYGSNLIDVVSQIDWPALDKTPVGP